MSVHRASVIGAGPYGLTLAALVGRAGHSVVLYTRDPERALVLDDTRRSSRLGIELPPNVHVTADLAHALSPATVLLTVPPRYVRESLREMAPLLRPGQRVAHAAKGLDPTGTSVSTAISEETCVLHTGVIGGPLVLESLWREEQTAALVASRFQAVIDDLTALLTSESLRVYGSLDILGAELGGALRTPVALAAGMLMEIGLGSSTRSVLLTRALVEGSRLAHCFGGSTETLSGLAGIGDWMVVAGNPDDDVVLAGRRMARGEAAAHPEAESRARALAARARARGIEMPVVSAVARVLEGEPVGEVLHDLMTRAARAEWE